MMMMKMIKTYSQIDVNSLSTTYKHTEASMKLTYNGKKRGEKNESIREH